MNQKDIGEYITTYTGEHFFPLSPEPERIKIEDIAHALSFICRGNGHVKVFYSVAEHCINCAREAMARGYGNEVVLACLLHDASECYMSDVPRPFKKFLKDYTEVEDELLSVIYRHFIGRDLTKDEAELVKEIDNDELKYDLFYLLSEGEKDRLPMLSYTHEYGVKSMKETKEEYIRLFLELTR